MVQEAPTAQLSLRPDERVSMGCVLNNEVAIAVRGAWRFSYPIKVLPASDPLWGREGDTTYEK